MSDSDTNDERRRMHSIIESFERLPMREIIREDLRAQREQPPAQIHPAETLGDRWAPRLGEMYVTRDGRREWCADAARGGLRSWAEGGLMSISRRIIRTGFAVAGLIRSRIDDRTITLWTSRETPETRGDAPGNTIDWPCRAFRWAFMVGAYDWANPHIGLYHQHQWKHDGSWGTSHVDIYEFRISLDPRDWGLGGTHVYYDGPHCGFSLGPMHFHWSDWDCRKCRPRSRGA